MGHKLGESVIASFDGTQTPEQTPVLSAAKVVGCLVPTGLTFLYAGSPQAMQHPSIDPPRGGKSLQTLTDRGYIQLNFDARNVVHSLVYMGRAALPVSRISALVGLHINYLNKVEEKMVDDPKLDLISFFTDSWADLVYHDQFPLLRQSLMEMSLAAIASGMPGSQVGTQVQEAVLEYIRARIAEMPGYHLPQAPKAS